MDDLVFFMKCFFGIGTVLVCLIPVGFYFFSEERKSKKKMLTNQSTFDIIESQVVH